MILEIRINSLLHLEDYLFFSGPGGLQRTGSRDSPVGTRGIMDAHAGSNPNDRKRQYPTSTPDVTSSSYAVDKERQKYNLGRDEPPPKRGPFDSKRGQTDFQDNRRPYQGNYRTNETYGRSNDRSGGDFGGERREGASDTYRGAFEKRDTPQGRQAPQARDTYDSPDMYKSKQFRDSKEDFRDRRDTQLEYYRDRSADGNRDSQDRFYYSQGDSAQEFGRDVNRNDQYSQYRSDGKRDVAKPDDYARPSPYQSRPYDADQSRADARSGLQSILDSRSGMPSYGAKLGTPSDAKSGIKESRLPEQDSRSRPFFGESNAPYHRGQYEGKSEVSSYGRLGNRQIFDYKNEKPGDSSGNVARGYDQGQSRSIEQRGGGRYDGTEGYSNRPIDLSTSFPPRDSYGSAQQRTDSRVSYGRDHYGDDAHKDFSSSSQIPGEVERRNASDQYASPGAKRDLPPRDSMSYRDDHSAGAKRGRYGDFPSSYQPSSTDSPYRPVEKRSTEQVDAYGRGPARGYPSENSAAGSRGPQGSYDLYSSGRYAPSKYDAQGRQTDPASNLEQSRNTDLR